MPTPIDYIVSVAARPTIKTWEATAVNLLRHVSFKRAELIVPDDQVRLFRAATPQGIDVSGEGAYIGEFSEALKDKLGPANKRYGWYLQQFIKLEAIWRQRDLARILIWDADTVPLKTLTFFTQEGTPVYFFGDEDHGPYFETIYSLLDMTKTADFSFVAQNFPITGVWVRAFFAELEERHSKPWWAAIIDSIDPAQASSFSEYETLGTFVHNRLGPVETQQEQNWTRAGYKHVKDPRRLLGEAIPRELQGFHFVAFENWVRPKKPWQKMIRVLRRVTGATTSAEK